MAQGDTPITIVGNLVADPELRWTPNQVAVCNFRIATTPRVYNRDTNQWEDGDVVFMTCNIWRQAAENAAETLTKGMRVIVQGNLKQRSYQTKEGEQRTVYEIEVDEVGPSLRYATATVNRADRNNNTQGQSKPSGWQVQDSRGGFGQQQQGQGQQGGWGEPAKPANNDTPPF